MAIKIKRGDELALPVKITMGGEPLSVDDAELVEFRLGEIRKLWPEDAEYDAESGEFRVRLSQEDTFSLPADDAAQLDVRVKFRGGAVIGTRKVTMLVTVDALSGEVI